ncbi:MAG: TolC family protein [Bacteroidia bacterium]|nr:TolC family protein [Bacteroidia bacterium]
MKQLFRGLLLLLSWNYTIAFAEQDSMVLSSERFLNLVRLYHPVGKQAELIQMSGDATMLKARGGFDPKLSFSNNQKYYNETNYFNMMSGGISIPTLFGLEFKGGMDRNNGAYINPENNLPSAGLAYAGVTLTLGQGLLIDERRMSLRQAELFQKSSKAERILMINDLLFEAGKYYWEWYAAYHNYAIYKDAFKAAQERLESVKLSSQLGDRPYIDTLEAFIQVNERQFSLIQSEMEYKNKSIQLSYYLWDENGQPLQLDPRVKAPEVQTIIESDALTLPDTGVWRSHPMLQVVDLKIQTLIVERQWKREQLKPILNLNYQPYLSSNTLNTYSMNDYKFGIGFKMPVLLRKERGDLKITNFKLMQATWDRSLKTQQLWNYNMTAMNEFNYTFELINQYRGTVQAYSVLLDAERNIFTIGESSLFMINSREMSYISAKIKLIDVIVKNKKAELNVLYMSGILGN